MQPCKSCNGRGAVIRVEEATIQAIVCKACGSTGIEGYAPPSKTGKVDPDKLVAFVNAVHRIARENEVRLMEAIPAEVKRETGVTPDLAVALAAISEVEPVLLPNDIVPSLKLYLENAHGIDAQWPGGDLEPHQRDRGPEL